MTILFVTRHAGTRCWARRRALAIDAFVEHLDVARVAAGDTVIGTLPVPLAAGVCARGARYLHLALDLPAEARGRELSGAEIERLGARLESYRIERVSPNIPLDGEGTRR